MTAMLELKEVSKSYGDKTVVDQLNLRIQKGEFVTILGTSGSGKTTTLKMMNGLIEPSQGQVLFEGQDLADLDLVATRRKIGYVVQQIGLFPHMTVAENIATVPKLLGWDEEAIQERVAELLDLVQLPAAEFSERYPRELSGGQQQRIGLARALAADPDVVLFDEPFGAIDAITRADLQAELLALHQKLGKTFVLITHDIYEAFKLGTRVVIMDQGKLVQEGSTKEIVEAPATEFVSRLLATAKEQESLWRNL